MNRALATNDVAPGVREFEIPEVMVPVFARPSRYKAIYGGRGSGKSHTVAKVLIAEARRRPGVRILCAREIQKSIKDSVKQLLADQIDIMGMSSHFDILDTEILGKNESRFLFAGLRTNPDNLKSIEGLDWAWVEEAHSMSQKSLEILTPTLRKPGSQLVFTWNPKSPKDAVDRMFRGEKGPPTDALVAKVNYYDNYWFNQTSLVNDMEDDKRRDPDKYAHIWLGEYEKNSESRVFHNWTVQHFDTPKHGAKFYLGVDWGFSQDPSVMIRCYFVGRKLFVDYEAYKIRCPIEQTPALFDTVPGARIWPCRADSARPETIDYMRRNGFPKMQSSIKGARSLVEGVEFIKNFDIIVHPRCKHTIDELTMYSYEIDEQTGDILPVFADKDNHVIDALRYAVEGKRRATGSIGIIQV